MNTIRDLIRLIRINLGRVVAEVASSVSIESLEALLAAVERQISQTPEQNIAAPTFEQATLQQASDLATYSARNAANLEMFKSVITTATTCARSLVLLNGGGAVALLAFIGHLATVDSTRGLIPLFSHSLLIFLIGVWTAGLFSGFLAFAQKAFAENWKRTGNVSAVICIMSGIASLILFLVASWCGAHALNGLAP